VKSAAILSTALLPLLVLGCGRGGGAGEVVLYCALDMEHSSTLVQDFPRKPGIAVRPLSDREREILQLIAKGVSNSEAAKVLNLSKATIRTHLEHIYQKLEVTNRVEAVTEGIRKGIIDV